MLLIRFVIAMIFFSSIISATTVNGRFVVVGQDSSKLSILLQLNTNTGSDDLGGTTIVVGFDNSLLNFPNDSQRNIDYYFHNFSDGHYSLGTVTRPSSDMVWINIDLPFDQNNYGTVVAGEPGWTDVVTINFEIINPTDSVNIYWQASSQFCGIFDGNNTVIWNAGVFENLVGRINYDITPPSLLSANLLDPTTLELIFSEPLEQSGAQNAANYSITNNINVISATLAGSTVTLTTTVHTLGLYTVTVSNVKDLAGNQIAPPDNASDYEYNPNSAGVVTKLKIFLDGPYFEGEMRTTLLNKSLIPLTQPYSVAPWNYNGNEEVSVVAQNTVDWILLELRTSPAASSIVSRRAAFLRKDGITIDLNGELGITFPGVDSGSYYVVVYHRNHLSIMTKNAIVLSDSSTLYDFTISQNKAYGNQAMKLLGSSKYGLYAADGDANGIINIVDKINVWRQENGTVGYKNGDFNLNGGVNVVDRNSKWRLNNGKSSFVPMN